MADSRKYGYGGVKGRRVARLLRQHPAWPKTRVAERAGCSLGRVYEVERALKAEHDQLVRAERREALRMRRRAMAAA